MVDLTPEQSLIIFAFLIILLTALLKSKNTYTIVIKDDIKVREQPHPYYGHIIQAESKIR